MNDDDKDVYDPAAILTRAALLFAFLLITFVCAIIVVQTLNTGEANTESWGALTAIIGWVTGVVGTIYANRFGSTQQSAAKDKTIAAQAATAVAAARATGQSITTPNVNIDADTTTITEGKT